MDREVPCIYFSCRCKKPNIPSQVCKSQYYLSAAYNPLTHKMRDLIIGGCKVTVIGEDLLKPNDSALLVVLAHGRGRSKEASIKFAHILMSCVPRLVCAVFDLPNHGERLHNESLNNSWNSGNMHHMTEMYAIIEQAAAEAATMFKYIPYKLKDIKFKGKVIVGTSLGGYITWKVASNNPGLLTAAVPIISSPDLPAVMSSRWADFEARNPEIAASTKYYAYPQETIDQMNIDVEKIKNLRKTSFPILAICGADDDLVPPEHTAKWAEDAAINQTVEFFPKIKHEVTRGMVDLTAQYLLLIHSSSP